MTFFYFFYLVDLTFAMFRGGKPGCLPIGFRDRWGLIYQHDPQRKGLRVEPPHFRNAAVTARSGQPWPLEGNWLLELAKKWERWVSLKS